MNCPNCQKSFVDTDFEFCPYCGKPKNSDQGNPSDNPQKKAKGSYGASIRAQVFEVIVRQALAGAPWQEICQGPMQVNDITVSEIEAEVRRRRGPGSGSTNSQAQPSSRGKIKPYGVTAAVFCLLLFLVLFALSVGHH